MVLDKFFGANFKILKLDECAKTKEFKNLGKQIADLQEDPEDERRRVRRDNFEINETDEDLCTESNIGSSANASRLGSRLGGIPTEFKRVPDKATPHYRANKETKKSMYNTSYNLGFFLEKTEPAPSKASDKRMKVQKETYFNYQKSRVTQENMKRSIEISPTSMEINESFNDSNFLGKGKVIKGFSNTNTKGFFQRRNSKERNFYQTNKNFNLSTKGFHSKKPNFESRSIFNALEEHNEEMRRKYGRRQIDGGRELPDDSTLVSKYKEKFGLLEYEYSDWSNIVQIKTLQRPVKRDSSERIETLQIQSKSSTLIKEIPAH